MSLLKMQGIKKSFNGVEVLHGVDLQVEKGQVHALLGENGAGKSTLMNILTGVYVADEGNISFDGHEYTKITINESEEYGIAFVHQELNLFNDLTVYDNIFLGKEYTKGKITLDKSKMVKEAKDLFERLGVAINPTEVVANLKPSEKQLLEISKALFKNAKLIILDEPTTSLNNDEVDHLFSIINGLKAEGISFIFISHKMPEIFKISDSYTVYRNGSFIATGKIQDTDPESITKLMVGEAYSSGETYEPRQVGDTVVSLKGYSGPGFKDINLDIKKGQIIGLTGLQGAGSSELLHAMFGCLTPTSGTFTVNGKKVKPGSIHDAMKHKIALLPPNRKENSVIPDMTILENMYLAEQTLSARHLPIKKAKEKSRYAKFKAMLNIKAESEDLPILSLSGGNQQKVFIARWLNTDAEVLLFDNPTQGIDVGAKAEIYKLILKFAQEGKTIIINTLEIPELQRVADKCVVFYDGRIKKILEHDEIQETKVMLYSTNAMKEEVL
ncbi:sugar ABC transporter ATP-binding protein [Pseudobutyrivibrio sp.]|uniref:sugar ABC transporter ATP-binding protein n=1 Tax=Pseudobutyrivibrio sp. TaxID=2014367 RepID=UPI001D397E48|nr:sugar ABC transporter ATP-binding protein [Pseudobutyrivibrio sp.]MBE5910330.1 sugar ABC transporter ATP-binding protein [Pseudobutyrivibrio sp.]